MAGERIRVYFDGACGVCRRSRDAVARLDPEGRIDWRDFRDPAARDGVPYPEADLAKEMFVRLPDGSWRRGFDGWRTVLLALPRRRWLGRLLGVPPFRWLGPPAYRWIARNRMRLGAPLGPSPGCDGSCPK